MVPVLINKDVFEPSYNDLNFMIQNHNYFFFFPQLLFCQPNNNINKVLKRILHNSEMKNRYLYKPENIKNDLSEIPCWNSVRGRLS